MTLNILVVTTFLAILLCTFGCESRIHVGAPPCVLILTKDFGPAICKDLHCVEGKACFAHGCTSISNETAQMNMIVNGNALFDEHVECPK